MILRYPLVANVVVAAICASCAAARPDPRYSKHSCKFAVTNSTNHVLEIRKAVRGYSTTSIGTLNPGELLTDVAPCAERVVYIRGTPVPSQAGAPIPFYFVHEWADLHEGEVTRITLTWP